MAVSLRSDAAPANGRQVALLFQPFVDLVTGRPSGAQALVRWRPAGQGPRPAEFIPFADEAALIVPLGTTLLAGACREAVAWPCSLAVSVNVSARQLRDSGLEADIEDVLHETGLTPGRLVLEITETSLMEQPDASVRLLGRLRDLGVRLAIDGFGTGYSSLAYLKRFPVDHLKIDRSFVTELGTRPEDAALVGAIVRMGHALGLRVLADGIETDQQLQVVADIGCDLGQGLYWSAPVTGSKLVAISGGP